MPTAFTAPSARGPERQETVVRYRPCALPSRILFTLLLSTLGAGFIVFAFFAARQVAVDCSRQTGLCVVTRTYPLFGPRRQSFDLAAIGGTSLRARRGKNGVLSYAVLLDTGAGPLLRWMPARPRIGIGRGPKSQEHRSTGGMPCGTSRS